MIRVSLWLLFRTAWKLLGKGFPRWKVASVNTRAGCFSLLLPLAGSWHLSGFRSIMELGRWGKP